MYKNQLQEVAQRSCFNLPSYTCIREGPDHAPRFKAIVNFNGDSFESPTYFSTLRQAEHSAAEVALSSLSSHSLASRILLDESGVYKNLLQEIAQRVGAPLPRYTTYRSGLGHLPVFTGIVELAGITFTGEPAKSKKQAEKSAAMAAWSSLKELAQHDASSSCELENSEEQEQIRIARALLNYRMKEKIGMASYTNVTVPFQKKFTVPTPRPSRPQPSPSTSKILPLFSQKTPHRSKPTPPPPPTSATTMTNDGHIPSLQQQQILESHVIRPQRFPAGTGPYFPVRPFRPANQGIAPPVTIRTAVPVFAAPPRPPPSLHAPKLMQPRPVLVAPPVRITQFEPVFVVAPVKKEYTSATTSALPSKSVMQSEELKRETHNDLNASEAVKSLENLKL